MVDVTRLSYKPGWSFKIGGPDSGFLCIMATTPDSGQPEQCRTTQHMFRLPDLVTDAPGFVRWVFDCLLLCEQHEAGEFFQVGDVRPFFPHHGDGGSPYDIVDRSEHITWD
jgi:hypothetical protein